MKLNIKGNIKNTFSNVIHMTKEYYGIYKKKFLPEDLRQGDVYELHKNSSLTNRLIVCLSEERSAVMSPEQITNSPQ